LDGDSVYLRSRHVLRTGVHDLRVRGLGLICVLDPDDHSADIGLVLDIGRYDLHDHGVSDPVAFLRGLVSRADCGLSGCGDTVCLEDLLALRLG